MLKLRKKIIIIESINVARNTNKCATCFQQSYLLASPQNYTRKTFSNYNFLAMPQVTKENKILFTPFGGRYFEFPHGPETRNL